MAQIDVGDGAAARLRSVRERIERAARDAGRDPASVTLVAVSKTFEIPDIEPVLAAGQRIFGENRVQEAESKWPALRERYPDIDLHLIGPLQSNKAREAVALFDVIETIDRPRIAEALAREMARAGRTPRLFVEVNVGGESQKAGVAPDGLGDLLTLCRDKLGLRIEGLMCVPPAGRLAAPYFSFLADLARRHDLAGLSMGMSADFEIAIACGATHVRVGTAIFGSRSPAAGQPHN